MFSLKGIYKSKSKVNENIDKYIDRVKKVFDIDYLLNEEQDQLKIKEYYKKSYWGYKLFNNSQSFIHFALSDKYYLRNSDYLGLVKIAEDIIDKNISIKNVLELASGKGANSNYLAQKFPNIEFSGFDLSQKPLPKVLLNKNYKQFFGDYHNLSQFESETFDFIFIIEALCYSTHKQDVLKEVFRILKPGGFFYISDGYALKSYKDLEPSEVTMIKLIERGMALNKIEKLDDFENIISHSNFKLVTRKNVSKQIIPNTIKFEFLARAFFKSVLLAKLIVKIFSIDFAKNAMTGLFIRTIMEREIGCYYIHILQKPINQ